MPSYIVTCPEGRLNASEKRQIAEAITRAHGDSTGAPYYFAQVTFYEVKAENYFLGGAPLECDQIFVHGTIREGRPREMKDALMARLARDVANASGMKPNCVWIYVSELPPTQMVEFGRVLPDHGKEAAWSAEMPAVERQRLEAIGIQKSAAA
jgi:phenylpyruvate tautomerase PptA (4-oxalocrotonate tautomerase family)